MTSRTTIIQSNNYVTLTVDGEETDYFVPNGGGYVRINDAAQRFPQVCELLSDRGNTLTATPDTLLALIRTERSRQLAAERACDKKWRNS